MKYTRFTLLSLLLINLMACSSDGERIFSEVSGKEGEIMMCWDKTLWDSPVNNAVEAVFADDMEGMTLTGFRDAEKNYRVMNIAPEGFGNVFQKHRNVVRVKFSNNYSKPVQYQKDVWARPQSVAIVNAKDTSDLIKNLLENKERLLKFFSKSEMDRIQYVYKKLLDDPNLFRINRDYHIDFILPRIYKRAVTKPGFEWFQYIVKGLSQQHLFLFAFDYTDPKTFTQAYMTKKINQMLRQNVKSGSKAYMELNPERDILYREYKTKSLPYVAEIKSLWRLNGGFMGGPFRAISFLDEKHNKVITLCGTVFAPQSKKRNLVREIEAILQSVSFVPEKKNS